MSNQKVIFIDNQIVILNKRRNIYSYWHFLYTSIWFQLKKKEYLL